MGAASTRVGRVSTVATVMAAAAATTLAVGATGAALIVIAAAAAMPAARVATAAVGVAMAATAVVPSALPPFPFFRYIFSLSEYEWQQLSHPLLFLKKILNYNSNDNC